jgi:hypothetical protein
MVVCDKCNAEIDPGVPCPVCAQERKDKLFHKLKLDDQKEKVITVWLNLEEQKLLSEAKRILEQEKDGTAFKQLALLGFKTLRSEETEYLLAVVFANKRKNKRLGVPDFEA